MDVSRGSRYASGDHIGFIARPPSWLIPVGDQETDALFTGLADHDPDTRWAEALVDTAAIPASKTRC